MKNSSSRILTTHIGSLVRPPALVEVMKAKESGQSYDREELAARVRDSTRDVVQKQLDSGIDVPSDGEYGKPSFSGYANERLSGFEPRPIDPNESPLLNWLEENLRDHGWKIIAFVRLNPAFPGPINFVFGLTSIRFIPYCWSTLAFLIPPAFLFAYVGSTVNQAVIGRDTPEIITHIIVISLVLTILTSFAVWIKLQLSSMRDN